MNPKINLEIIPISESDLDALAAIEATCFSEPWSANALRLLLGETAFGYVAKINGRTVGYGGMLIALDEGQITNIAVAPDARRMGCGAAILHAMLSAARDRGLIQIALEVRVGNTAAIRLYETNGFSVAGRRKHFYRDPTEDAFVMLRDLTEN